jgi:hypothetical protein
VSVAVAKPVPASEVVHVACCPVHGPRTRPTHLPCDVCGEDTTGVAMVPAVIEVGEPCACGCRLPKRRNSDYATDACRTAHWKVRTGYVHPDSRAARNARNGAQTRLLRRPRPGGRQVSFGVAVRVLARYLVEANIATSEAHARAVAERVLTRALPKRQRYPRPRASETRS